MQLSEHFTLAELTHTDTGLDNTPNGEEIETLRVLAMFLEKARAILGQPMIITSAFRSAAVNQAVGGVPTSAHRLCYAADFVCDGYGSPYDVCMAISRAADIGTIAFDQLIQEGSWTHISRDPRLRDERLTLVAGGYVPGIHRS